jgi:hypothetical protein
MTELESVFDDLLTLVAAHPDRASKLLRLLRSVRDLLADMASEE